MKRKEKMSQFRQMSVEELKKKLEELKDRLYKLRFQRPLEGLPKHTQIKDTKKDIARILLVLREKGVKI